MARKFEYLLNAFEEASQDARPAEVGYADKRLALLAHVRELERIAKRYQALQEQYVAADFVYPQFEGHTALVFAFPKGTSCSANLDHTLDMYLAETAAASEPK